MASQATPQLNLNWKEIALLASRFSGDITGLFVDRVIVPERPRFREGYLKGEWAVRLTGKHSDGILLFSIRPRHPYFVYLAGKGPKAANQATRSPFDLELSKHLKGQRLQSVEVVERERTVVFWFAGNLGLVLSLIPAAPEALLVRGEPGQARWEILTRSRTQKKNEGIETHFVRPDAAKAPADPPVREELFASVSSFARELSHRLDAEAFQLRVVAALREIREKAKLCRERIRQSETSVREAEADRDWQRFGNLLKASLYEAPAIEPGSGGPKSKDAWIRRVRDYETDEMVALPADPSLEPAAQVEKFYQLARRKSRRISEAGTRAAGFHETLVGLDLLLSREPEVGDWKALEALERAAGTGVSAAVAPGEKPRKSSAGAWLGKTFVSKDGLTIMVGRSRDENLELTFKHARGNDIWMHVRGRPGAHAVIPVQSGKSAPLETLLDAATLTIFYSGGEKWGTTEVDYTFKKHVKRIKDSTEASYTHNKTLLVQPDPVRIKRLLG